MEEKEKALRTIKSSLYRRVDVEINKLDMSIKNGGGGVHELGVLEGLRTALALIDIELLDVECNRNKKDEKN